MTVTTQSPFFSIFDLDSNACNVFRFGFVAYEKFAMFLDFGNPLKCHQFEKTSFRIWNMELKPKFELLRCSILESQLLQLVF